jgi:hypothetical protein
MPTLAETAAKLAAQHKLDEEEAGAIYETYMKAAAGGGEK